MNKRILAFLVWEVGFIVLILYIVYWNNFNMDSMATFDNNIKNIKTYFRNRKYNKTYLYFMFWTNYEQIKLENTWLDTIIIKLKFDLLELNNKIEVLEKTL